MADRCEPRHDVGTAHTLGVPGHGEAVAVVRGRVGTGGHECLHERQAAAAHQRVMQGPRPDGGGELVRVGTERKRLVQARQVVMVELTEQRVGAGPACTGLHQRVEDRPIGLLGGVVQRLVVVGVGAGAEQRAHDLAVAGMRRGAVEHRQGMVSARHTQSGVGICAVREQPAHRGAHPIAARSDTRQARERGDRDRRRGQRWQRLVHPRRRQQALHGGKVTTSERQHERRVGLCRRTRVRQRPGALGQRPAVALADGPREPGSDETGLVGRARAALRDLLDQQRPAREAVLARQHQLRLRERGPGIDTVRCRTLQRRGVDPLQRTMEVPRLATQMVEVRVVGQNARAVVRRCGRRGSGVRHEASQSQGLRSARFRPTEGIESARQGFSAQVGSTLPADPGAP